MSQNQLRRQGLLGGSFDPVHFGHLGLAHEVLQRFQLDNVVFIPTHVSPHKQEQPVTPSLHRQEMLRLSIQDNRLFELSDIEIRRQETSYTIDTLNALRENDPTTEFYLIMAADTFQDLVTWKEYRRILESYNLVVASRPGFPLKDTDGIFRSLYGESIPYDLGRPEKDGTEFRRKDNGRSLSFFNLKEPRDISSSEIRNRFHQNVSVKNFLPPQVEQYIIKHNLYKFTEQDPRTPKE